MDHQKPLTDSDILMTDQAGPVKELLTALGWSQSQLSRASGVSQQAISLFLKGKMNLTPATADKVLTALEAEMAIRHGSTEKSQNHEALMNLIPPRDPAAYRQWKERMINRDGKPGEGLALTMLVSALQYMGQHMDEFAKDVINEAGRRLALQLEPMMKETHSRMDVARWLGIYVARLELGLAQSARRIVELEAQVEMPEKVSDPPLTQH